VLHVASPGDMPALVFARLAVLSVVLPGDMPE